MCSSDLGAGGYGAYFGSVPDFSQVGKGVRFAEVRSTSPAGQAGLRGGDVLVEFAGKPINARLYVTGAEYEWPGFLAGIQRYQALLPELKHPGLVFQNRTIDGERHAGTKAESYTRGMRFVFEPLAPETGKSSD